MRPSTPFNRVARWLIVVAAIGLILILAVASLKLGGESNGQQIVGLSPFPTLATANWTPIAPFAQVDPAIIAYLQFNEPQPLQVLGDGIPPIGAYLPQSGDAHLAVMTWTPSPTITAVIVSTTTLKPTAAPTTTLVPTETPNAGLVATVKALVATPTIEAPTAIIIVPTIPTPTHVAPGIECAPSGLPVAGLLTQRYYIGHIGIDLAVPPGTPVKATQSGYVEWDGWNDYGYGNLVVIHSGHFITYYGHNTSVTVKKGDYVNKGDVIALSGSTGHSSGPHVHYETRINNVTVDPLTFEARGYHSC